jgi:DNA-binding CsgD family transcriptional regulator
MKLSSRLLAMTAQRPSHAGSGASNGSSDAPSRLGLLLLNSSLSPVYVNSEAVQILTYPGKPAKARALYKSVWKTIRSQLYPHLLSLPRPSLTHLRSGKRRYVCRTFSLELASRSPIAKGSFQPAIAVLIERRDRAPQELAQIAERYRLTTRERQTMELVTQGLTSKEIATQMNISPNTVKVFLRLITVKLGVSTPSGILGKIVSTV